MLRGVRYAPGAQIIEPRTQGFQISVRTPEPSVAQCLGEALVQVLYACLARALSSVLGGALRGLGESSYRLYNCWRCAVQVRLCSRCDHGNIYCAAECAQIRRLESCRRAGARYQRTRRGAHHHAARQMRWRMRQRQEVTHQGCAGGGGCGSVSQPPTLTAELPDAHRSMAVCTVRTFIDVGCCSLCGAPLPPWTHPRRWPWSG